MEKSNVCKANCKDVNCAKNCKGCSVETPRKQCEFLGVTCNGCKGYEDVKAKFES